MKCHLWLLINIVGTCFLLPLLYFRSSSIAFTLCTGICGGENIDREIIAGKMFTAKYWRRSIYGETIPSKLLRGKCFRRNICREVIGGKLLRRNNFRDFIQGKMFSRIFLRRNSLLVKTCGEIIAGSLIMNANLVYGNYVMVLFAAAETKNPRFKMKRVPPLKFTSLIELISAPLGPHLYS